MSKSSGGTTGAGKFGNWGLFLVAKGCSEVKGPFHPGGRWREYLPSLEGIQEDCRVRGQSSKGRGGLCVTQLFWGKKKRKKRNWVVIPGEAFFREVESMNHGHIQGTRQPTS